MRNIYSFLTIIVLFISSAQFNPNAPWNTTKSNKNTFNEEVENFNNYWQGKDFRKKGSGYKPFKRWENYWKNLVKPDGSLITYNDLTIALNQKKESKNSLSNRNSNSNSNRSLPVSNWTPVGPFTHTNTGSWSSGQGRVNVIYEDPSNSNIVYVGTPAGGIWRSINNGTTWTSLSDQLPQIGVSGIAVAHDNPNLIYIVTGDRDAFDTNFAGVFFSTDSGVTWNNTGLLNGATTAGDLIIHPTNNQILWCATDAGVFKTTNGGATWINVRAGNFSQGSIRLKPTNPSIVYATTTNRFYKSTDSGTTFTTVSTGISNTASRILLDVTPADINYVYLLSTNSSGDFDGIYRSTNSGSSWTKTSNTTTPDIFDGSGQSFYDMALAVSTSNKNEVYTGVLNVWKSSNSGLGFTKINDWNQPSSSTYTHADIHYLKFFGSKLYAGTDGGIYVSNNNGTSFTDLTTGLQISQFYKVAVSKQTAGKMVGGLQDNGGHAYSGNTWKNYYGADGMDTAIDPTNSDKYFGFVQFGGSLYISNNAGQNLSSVVNAPTIETNSNNNDDGGNWVTPLIMNNQGDLFAGYSRLYKLNNNIWVQQSSNTIGNGDIDIISIAPNNNNIVFVANENTLYKSIDGGVNFNNVYNTLNPITSICVNYSNENTIYITTSGTNGEALKSIDGGINFTSISQNLPNIGKNIIIHQGRHSLNPLYLGTTLGVYYRDDSMSQWEPFDANLPNTSVTDLEINLEESILIAATYGRGIWQTSIPFETPAHDIKFISIEQPTILTNCSGNISPQITVKNNGLNVINNVNITYNYNGNPQNYLWTGTIQPNTNQSITLPSINITDIGIYELNFSTTILNDANSENNLGKTNFKVNSSGIVGIVNNFETQSNNLLTHNEGSNTSQWQRGINTTTLLATPSNNVYTTNISGNYPDNAKSYLYSQCYDLTNVTQSRVKFKMAFDLETNFDVVYVEYSTNLGQNWNVLGTQGLNWYNSNRTPFTTGNDCERCVGAQWTGTNSTLTEYFYPLTALEGQSNVIFRIVFVSDQSSTQQGVIIDDFVIEGTLSNESFNLNDLEIYPNPTKGNVIISVGNNILKGIEVYNTLGKIVQKNNYSNQNISSQELDLTSLSNGVYFIKINANNEIITRKIVKI